MYTVYYIGRAENVQTKKKKNYMHTRIPRARKHNIIRKEPINHRQN